MSRIVLHRQVHVWLNIKILYHFVSPNTGVRVLTRWVAVVSLFRSRQWKARTCVRDRKLEIHREHGTISTHSYSRLINVCRQVPVLHAYCIFAAAYKPTTTVLFLQYSTDTFFKRNTKHEYWNTIATVSVEGEKETAGFPAISTFFQLSRRVF